MNPSLSIRLDNTGEPLIVVERDNLIFMLLSAKGASSRYGHGLIKVLESQSHLFHVIAEGHGAHGCNGRVGHWDCRLISLVTHWTNCIPIVQVRPSGGGYGIKPTQLYIIHNQNVYECTADTIANCCTMLGIQMPITLSGVHGDGPNGICSREQWRIL